MNDTKMGNKNGGNKAGRRFRRNSVWEKYPLKMPFTGKFLRFILK